MNDAGALRSVRNADDLDPSAPRQRTLVGLGLRLRAIRARRGLTRKATAAAADVSERYLANLEHGIGNPSVLILEQLAAALECPIAELLGDETTASPEWLLLRELLAGRTEAELRQARLAITGMSATDDAAPKARRLALIGLRGAGKSTLGRMLAERLRVPFAELSREIERIAGCDIRQIHDLYGTNAYRRYERRALEQVIARHAEAVIAIPGGLVSDAATFRLLLERTTTIWLEATPEEHMQRVVRQGDLRPMAGHDEAMADLRQILSGRAAFYAKADYRVVTSGRPVDAALAALVDVALLARAKPTPPVHAL